MSAEGEKSECQSVEDLVTPPSLLLYSPYLELSLLVC